MSKSTLKYYVVWKGKKPGVYATWKECQEQIHGFAGALYKSFPTRPDAEQAFKMGSSAFRPEEKLNKAAPLKKKTQIITPSLAVDAACSGNPGRMEYQGVNTATREVLFHQGPYADGTNNIGEFLAIVHALALLKKHNRPTIPIYSDSKTAMGWVLKKKCNTKLPETGRNEAIFILIRKAEDWLEKNTWTNPILKWETDQWGEIPADFGRK
jgi:ribonuclease HI